MCLLPSYTSPCNMVPCRGKAHAECSGLLRKGSSFTVPARLAVGLPSVRALLQLFLPVARRRAARDLPALAAWQKTMLKGELVPLTLHH